MKNIKIQAIIDLTDENIYYIKTSDNKKIFVAKANGIEGKLECYEWMYRNCNILYNQKRGTAS